jgi:DNA gyrase inhibitor GyrI
MLIILLVALAAVIGLAIAGYRTSRAAYETAPYKVVRADGKFELRDYPALTVVETPMVCSASGANNGFMRLFRFITGQNEAKQQIAMTTPVFMSGNDSNATMAFVMPATWKASEVPKPADGAVTVRELEAGRFAVLRFSGGRNAQNEAEAALRLRTWMAAQGLKAVSAPVYGYFDPPWTPSFLRRNEVMLRAEAGR